MYIPAWQITTWNDVSVSLAEWNASMGKLRHLGTSSQQFDKETGLRCGQALWGSEAANDIVGIAWDWREVRPGVVAMSDPMTVLSNAVLVDDDGRPVDSFKRILHLNNAIFSLPWQMETRGRETEAEALAA